MSSNRTEGLVIQKAERREAKLRFFLSGRSGAGKSTTAAIVGAYIAQAEGVPMIYIDSEEGSAKKLADVVPGFSFDEIPLNGWLNGYSPQRYMHAIRMAIAAGAGVIIIDSISQSWSGKDGVLEQVDEEKRRSNNPDKQAAWAVGTKLWNDLVALIVGAPAHVIVCARSKTVYSDVVNDRGKMQRVAVGTDYVAREGFEYEFDLFGDLEREGHILTFDKNRSQGKVADVWEAPGMDLGKAIHQWLREGGADITMRTRELKQLAAPGVTGAMIADALLAAGLAGKEDFVDDAKFAKAREVVRELKAPVVGPAMETAIAPAEAPVPAPAPVEPAPAPEPTPEDSAPETATQAPPSRTELTGMTVIQLKEYIATLPGFDVELKGLKKRDVVDRILGYYRKRGVTE